MTHSPQSVGPAYSYRPFAEPSPEMTAREALDLVNAFDDSTEGPIRFPGSIAESNQGPDPRYQSWMELCLPLAAEEAGEPWPPK